MLFINAPENSDEDNFGFAQLNFAFIGRIQQLLPSDLSQQLKLLKGVNTC